MVSIVPLPALSIKVEVWRQEPIACKGLRQGKIIEKQQPEDIFTVKT